MQLNDGEVSGQHAAVRWSSVDKCWKVRLRRGGGGPGVSWQGTARPRAAGEALSQQQPCLHACATTRHAQVADLGSLNGTLLNGEPISVAGRKRGSDYRLSSDDILQVGGVGEVRAGVGLLVRRAHAGHTQGRRPPSNHVPATITSTVQPWKATTNPCPVPLHPPPQLGSFTKIKVSTFPRDLLDPLQSRCGSLPGQCATRAPRLRLPLRAACRRPALLMHPCPHRPQSVRCPRA